MDNYSTEIENLKKISETDPLLAIDRLFEVVPKYSLKKNEALLILNILYKSIVAYKNLECENGKVLESLFKSNIGFESQKFISVCFLRLLNSNDKLFTFIPDNYKIFSLFDKTLVDVYKNLSIQTKDENYNKESKLKDFVKSIEDIFKRKINIENLDSLEVFESEFLKGISNNINKILFLFFIPSTLVEKNKLTELFQAIKEYKKSTLSKRSECYEKSIESIERFVKDAEKLETKYTHDILITPFKKIAELIKADFDQTPYMKHTELEILPSGKKYPFAQINASFKLSFLIKNTGEGFAYNTKVSILNWSSNIVISKTFQSIGQIDNKQMLIEFDCNVTEKEELAMVSGELIWEDYKSSKEYKNKFEFDLVAQRSDINWEILRSEDPYSPESVETQDKLVGRNEIVNNLKASIKNKVGSFYIFGQKRVGKTSIVKTVKNIINKNHSKDFLVLYIEGGEFTDKQPEKTLVNLALKICKRIKESDLRFSGINIPNFEGSFTPVSDFLDTVISLVSDIKILMIIDEFDEISPDLYKRTEIGNSFFLTLRAISNKAQFGFWFVGGEKMEFIISCQGEQLNKFQSIRVDYFDKENAFYDFKDLVRNPVSDYFEISDNAIDKLYLSTAGNPFFTKIICRHLFKYMVGKRDNHITETEMDKAISIAINEEETQIFAHFWEDGIKGRADEEEEISMRRRKVLLAVAYIIKEKNQARKESVIEKARNLNIQEQEAISTLREFEERNILNCVKDVYYFKVAFFGNWLLEKGIEKVITTLSDGDKINERKQREVEQRITSKELMELSEKWGIYKGQEVTTDKIRNWLEQFDSVIHQRTILKILQSITFYNDITINSKMEEIFKTVRKKTIVELKEGKKKRDDILVSYLDSPGKSGAEYAKLFVDRNDIYVDNIVVPSKIERTLNDNRNIKVLVFIDDFIGTGSSICDLLDELNKSHPFVLRNQNLKIHLGIICGFGKAKQTIEAKAVELGIDLNVILCDVLNDSDRCFSENSKIYTDNSERITARAICYDKGSALVKTNPLGYGDCQATIVFSKTCPNNTLPILWKESNDWNPLFKRI